MKIQDRSFIQAIKTVIILAIIMVAFLQSCVVKGQGLKKFVNDYQVGFEGSFGIKTFSLTSNISAINGLNVTEEGGTIGVTAGAKAVRINLRQGYFYSSSTVAQTVDEVRSALAINFYPLRLVSRNNSRLQPYITGGMERNILKMYGTYSSENNKPRNYSVSEAPYLGKIASAIASFGAGLEYTVKAPGHFVSFFAEGRYGKVISTTSSNAFFSRTNASDQLAVNVGIGFGYNR